MVQNMLYIVCFHKDHNNIGYSRSICKRGVMMINYTLGKMQTCSKTPLKGDISYSIKNSCLQNVVHSLLCRKYKIFSDS